MKPIKSCVATGDRKFCNIYDVALMPVALSTISIKPAKIKDLLRPAELTMLIIMLAVLLTIPTKPAEL
jgi:hypothetical protein